MQMLTTWYWAKHYPKNSTHMYLCLVFEKWSTLDTISIHFGWMHDKVAQHQQKLHSL